ncbi:hypothetical protein NDU88_002715 [Pleurodeles waltl]|uniref:Uncharacterized protein n=1 Tax=Pleurodeles waltl TaxID=8319 RepID=A0AAV7WMA1_PLEWA|nr:hypothetical protein NDU88_002715 [Pleurodeles waltl]
MASRCAEGPGPHLEGVNGSAQSNGQPLQGHRSKLRRATKERTLPATRPCPRAFLPSGEKGLRPSAPRQAAAVYGAPEGKRSRPLPGDREFRSPSVACIFLDSTGA